jgi:radical SAM superfamily enzyme YgiQ (UPF0313 family)
VTARVVLVGFEDQDNLGLRYLSSRLRQSGHDVRIVALTGDPRSVLAAIREVAPHVVGFSLIFQFMAPQFASLLAHLRRDGVTAHFTMGGHYASFDPDKLLELVPALDSVVRYEGEDTIVELAERVRDGTSWRDVLGLALRGPGGVVKNDLRPGREDLDELPWPDRDDICYAAQAMPTASMLASRGCPWKCSFCSIITFYADNGTPGRRRREPQRVIDEIEYLHRERGVRVILWQDDDFLAGGKMATAWALDLARGLTARGLHRTLRWKISCRSDEIRDDLLGPLVEAGLCHVYLGVESGDDQDLRSLNKLLKPRVHLRAGQILRKLGVSFDFGYMLLNPWSTLRTLRSSARFLAEFSADGATVAGFCRMMPYAGTPAETRLRAEGRLLEQDFDVDYAFLDSRLDVFYDWSLHAFLKRNFAVDGTWNLLRVLLYEAHLAFPDRPIDPVFRDSAHALTAVSNQLLLSAVERAVDVIEAGADRPDHPALIEIARQHDAHDTLLRGDIAQLMRSRPDISEQMHVTR